MDDQAKVDPQDVFYRHIPGDWVDANGNLRKEACQIKHLQQGLSCDWSRLRNPAETALGTGHDHVMCIKASDCATLGLSMNHKPVPDKYRPGEINRAHFELLPPLGTSDRDARKLRDELLKLCEVKRVTPSA